MEFPRVTEVLRPFSNFQHVPEKILKNAAARGTSVHALCAAIAKGAWLPETMIQDECKGYVKSFNAWRQEFVQDFLVIENRYTDEDKGYTGQVDFVVTGKDTKTYLVDLKTSARPQKTYSVQMGAYQGLLLTKNISIHAAVLVYLDKDGEEAKTNVIENLQEESHVFMCALDCYKYFHKGKSK